MEKSSEQTMRRIHNLSNERFNLYLKASSTRLDKAQIQRVQDITGQLAIAWDEYRRELASERYSRPPVAFPTAKTTPQQAA